MKTAVIAGATGLVGTYLLAGLLSSDRYGTVTALSRKALPVNHPKLQTIFPDFRQPEKALEGLIVDDVFCCLGTTMAKAGSKEKFFEVDFEYPYALARACLALGAKQYLLVSSLGAKKKSAIYYNRVKGEVEEAIQGIGFDTVHILRPSLLFGPRAEERRGEDAAKWLYKTFGFAIPVRYKGIEAEKVARAMVHFAARDEKGIFIHESPELQYF